MKDFFKDVWFFFTNTCWTSWFAHSLAATAATYILVWVYLQMVKFNWGWLPVLTFQKAVVFAATPVLLYYVFKEMSDYRKHYSKGEWKKKARGGQVTWAADGKADLVGPFTVWLAAHAAYWIS